MIIKSTSGYLGNPQKLVKRIMLPQLVYNLTLSLTELRLSAFVDTVPVTQET
jgi:hypothetical protein